jgi:hypothetical protein
MARRLICSLPCLVRLNSQSGLSQSLDCLYCRILHILKIITNIKSAKEGESECKFTVPMNQRQGYNKGK